MRFDAGEGAAFDTRSMPLQTVFILLSMFVQGGCAPGYLYPDVFGQLSIREQRIVVGPAHQAQLRRMIVASNILSESAFVKIRDERIVHNGNVKLPNPDALSAATRECIQRVDYRDYLKWVTVTGGRYFTISQAREAADFFETASGQRVAKEIARGHRFSVSDVDQEVVEPYREALQHFQSAAPRFLSEIVNQEGVLVSLMVSDCLALR